MKSQILYLSTLALHVALLYLFTHFNHYRRNPAFWLWLMTGLGMNLALIVLAWAGEVRAFSRARAGGDALWYALAAASLWFAFSRYHDPVNRIVLRGTVVLLVLTVIARRAGVFGLVGGAGARFADAINFAYLAPTLYMLWALSGMRADRLPLLAKQILLPLRGLRMAAGEAFGWARAMLG